MLSLASNVVVDSAAAADSSAAASNSLLSVLTSLFSGIPESYSFFIYFVMAFIVCISFKFLIDFIKIVFSYIFNRGGF